MERAITSGIEVRKFWEENAGYKNDSPQNGGRSRILAVEVDGHLIIGTSLKDYAGKLWSHELNIHKYCLPLEEGWRDQ